MKRFAALLSAVMMALALPAAAEPITVCGVLADTQDAVLDLSGVRDVDAQELAAAIEQMPNLVKADMYDARLDKAHMASLFDTYPQVDFGWTIKMAEHTVRTDATAFSTLHNSHSEAHGAKTFEPLRFCRHLKAIDIGHNWVEDLSFLQNFPELKVLILGRNQVRDLTVIGELTQLEYLEIFSNHLTDISELAKLKNLKDLNISYNKIDDITPLHGMTQLERLWGYKNKTITEEEQRAFEAAVPGCETDWVNNPTEGTWREHPRYFIIREMFRSGVYIPFDDAATPTDE